MNIKELYELKIGALIHDPVTKTALFYFDIKDKDIKKPTEFVQELLKDPNYDELKESINKIKEYKRRLGQESRSELGFDEDYVIANLHNYKALLLAFVKHYFVIRKELDTKLSRYFRLTKNFLMDEKDGKTKQIIGEIIFKETGSSQIGLYNIFSRTWKTLDTHKVKTYLQRKEGNLLTDVVFQDIRKLLEIFRTTLNWDPFVPFDKLDDESSKTLVRLLYLYFWTFLDIIYLKRVPVPLPEDTRSPITDIIDHLYAVVSATNLVDFSNDKNNSYKTILLLIDFAGIQDFIRAARKFRDQWLSSILISLFAWKVVEPFLIYYGPDILLRPTARLNPLWLISLLNYTIRLSENNQALKELLNKINKEFIDNYYNSLFVENAENNDSNIDDKDKLVKLIVSNNDIKLSIKPVLLKTALVPPTMLLMIPSLDESDIRELLEIFTLLNNEYIKKTELDKIVASITKHSSVEERASELVKFFVAKLWEKLLNLSSIESKIKVLVEVSTEYADSEKKNYQIKVQSSLSNILKILRSRPPFALRIVIKEYKGPDLLEKFVKSELFEDFKRRVLRNSTLKIDAYQLDYYSNFSNEAYLEKKRLVYCTVCSRNPAILIIPREHYNEFIKKVSDELGSSSDYLKIIFKPGEKLCGYCLIKRLLSSLGEDPRSSSKGPASSILSFWLGHVASEEIDYNALKFPSTLDIAYIYYLETTVFRILEKYLAGASLSEDEEHILNQLRKLGSQASNDEESFFENYFYYAHEVIEKLDNIKNNSDKVKELNQILTGIKRLYYKLAVESSNLKNKSQEYYQIKKPYLASIYADGDFMGEIFSKTLEFLDFETILEDLYGDSQPWKVKLELKDQKTRKTISLKHYKDVLDPEIYDSTAPDKSKLKIKTNISLWSQLSRALMVSAIKEMLSLEKKGAFVLYIGGDDLRMMVPLHKLVEIIKESKNIYHGLVSEKRNKDQELLIDHQEERLNEQKLGFHKIGFNYTPALGILGRTYVVAIHHEEYPLAIVNQELRRLEQLKGDITYCRIDSRISKNLLILSYYSRSGKRKLAILPFYPCKSFLNIRLKDIKDIINYYFEEIFDPKTVSNYQIPKRRFYALLENNTTMVLRRKLIENSILKNKENVLKLLLKEYFEGSRKEKENKIFDFIESLLHNQVYKIEIKSPWSFKDVRDFVLFEIFRAYSILVNFLDYSSKREYLQNGNI
jgi:CRISPR-associated protein Cmr2